jgi:hypothetical protein
MNPVSIERGQIWRHRKGSVYRITGTGILEATLAEMVIYVAVDAWGVEIGPAWIRPLTEFLDGRFTKIGYGGKK